MSRAMPECCVCPPDCSGVDAEPPAVACMIECAVCLHGCPRPIGSDRPPCIGCIELMSDPVIRLGHPMLRRPNDDELVEVEPLLELRCSLCGEIADWETPTDEGRQRLTVLALEHAEQVHGGVVGTEGWELP